MKRLNNKVFKLAGTQHAGMLPKLRKDGFTLAEVLITLGIIGIVSALTLPVLIQNINGHKYRNQFKKSFSTLSQAVKLAQEAYELSFAMLDQTCEQTGADANPRNNRSMCAMFNGTLKGATYVGPASDIYKEKDIKIGDYPISDYLVYRLSDGSLVGFYKNLKTCTVPTGTQLTESVLTGSGALKNCLGFIDVNGDKNPNDIVQGTSADSISWLFGMPTAFGYGDYDTPCGDEYCCDARGNFCCGINCTDEYAYTEADLKYNAQGQRGIGDEYIYDGYNAQGQLGAGVEYIYNPWDLKYNAQGQWGVGDGFIYDSSDLKYNAQGQRGVGEGFYNQGYGNCTRNDRGGYNCFNLANGQYENIPNYIYEDYFAHGEIYENTQENSTETENNPDKCNVSSFDPSATCSVPNRRGFISDIFPIVFHDGVVEPASGPARAVLHQTK